MMGRSVRQLGNAEEVMYAVKCTINEFVACQQKQSVGLHKVNNHA